MSSFACNWPWLFGGLLGGWLLWQLFDRFFRRDGEAAGVRVRRDLESAHSRLGALNSEMVAANAKIGQVRTELDTNAAALKVKSDEALRMQTELTDWRAKFSALEASTGTAAAAAAAALAGANDKAAKVQADLDAANAALREQRKAAEQLAKELDEWKARHSGVKSELSAAAVAATAAAAAAATALGTASARGNKLQAELETASASLRAATEGHAKLSAELSSGSETIGKLRAELASLSKVKADLHTSTESQNALRTQLSASTEAQSVLRAELSASHDANAKLRTEQAGNNEAQAVLRAELASLNATLERVKGELSSATERNAKFNVELAAATDAQRRAVADLEAMRGRVATLERDMAAASASLGSANSEAATLRASLADCRAQHVALTEEMSRASASAASARAFASAAEYGITPRRGGRDDLLIIEGIGPKINELLINGGIDTFAKLASAEVAEVQAILDAAGPKFRLANPASWARQAAMCDAAAWSELKEYQETLRAGVASGMSKASEERMLAAAAAFGFTPRSRGMDDLTIIEGIGPKINELLVNAGIDTFRTLAETPLEKVQVLLDAAGPNFRLANPGSWARQSKLCSAGKWKELKALQDELQAGIDPGKERGA